MKLYIAEKPDLGKAIAEGLGGGRAQSGYIQCGDDVVTWCFGHLLQLTDPEDHDPSTKRWSMDQLPMRWPIEHKPILDKKSQVALIKKLAAKATSVVHAGDPDEEGQLLVDELLTFIGNKKPVERVLINDMNPKIVKRARGSLRNNREFYPLYQSALARAVSDQHYGYNLTRAYTLAGRATGGDTVLSVGRVQTPMLGLVVRRDRAHESHLSSKYWSITGQFLGERGAFQAKYLPSDDAPVDDKGRIIDPAFAAQVSTDTRDREAVVVDQKTVPKTTPQPLPYNLLKLQIDASSKFGFSPDQTLKATQSLREKHKLITYNRSDCEYLSEEQHGDAKAVLSAISTTATGKLSGAVASADAEIMSRAFNSKNISAHHAIIPTETVGDLSKLSDVEAKLYLIIARAYVAQFHPHHAYNETTVKLCVESHDFQARSTVVVTAGWKDLYPKGGAEGDETDNTGASLEWVSSISSIRCVDTSVEEKTTKPPKQYTMATLLKDLAQVAKYVQDPRIKALLKAKDADKKGEHGGIGTPATRSAIIKQLLDRGYIAEKGKTVSSTDLGRDFHDKLPESATTPDMTALWHEQQEMIRNGVMTSAEFVEGVSEYVAAQVQKVKSSVPVNIKTARKPVESSGISCPDCKKGELVKRAGKKGGFWGCNCYPECSKTLPDKKGAPDIDAKPKPKLEVSKDKLCSQCGKGMVRRESGKIKGTHWWGCSGFPKCRNIDND